ncbi:MAG: four helix bundle protein [Patescibacteria group bacterium]|nr:four helix bundle protein [Patescibacteria group bacterium]
MANSNITNSQFSMAQKNYDIHKRIFSFVVRVLNLTKSLPKTSQNIVLINQITRSVTSMGANDQEADGTNSRRDFFHCYTVVKKETKETNFWLKVISSTNSGFSKRMELLIKEGGEIEAIVSSIVKKGKC